MLFRARTMNPETFFVPILKFELCLLVLMSPKNGLFVLFVLGFTQLDDKMNEQNN